MAAVGMSKYAVVRESLAQRIAAMEPGDQLPIESVLCEEFGVSRITVRRAVDDLASEGLVERQQGRGTFVMSPKVAEPIRETFRNEVAGFFREQTALGRTVATQVLGNRVVHNPDAARALDLAPTDELIELERLRYVGDELHQHVLTYLSARDYPAIIAQDFTDGSLFDFLEERYGIYLVRNDLLVQLTTAGGDIAGHLQVEAGSSILAIGSTVYTADDQPVAFGIASHTPEHSEIAFSLRGETRS